jgi:hypothetical protein
MLKHASKQELKPLELRPSDPSYMLDSKYILSAMGLLSLEYPEVALNIMKKEIKVIAGDS